MLLERIDLEEVVLGMVSEIPKGKVATYGQIAKMCGELVGLKVSPRYVGRVLHNNKDPRNVPCHRVVNYKGRVAENFAFGGEKEQIKRLKLEGVKVQQKKVVLEKCLWSDS